MATRVYAEKELTLQDDTEVTVRPLPIARLRRFHDAWKKLGEIEDPDNDGYDVFINCCGIALENNFKDKFETLDATAEKKKKGEFLSPEYKDYLLEVLELDTIYVILDVAGQIKLNDPKVMEQALKEWEAKQANG